MESAGHGFKASKICKKLSERVLKELRTDKSTGLVVPYEMLDENGKSYGDYAIILNRVAGKRSSWLNIQRHTLWEQSCKYAEEYVASVVIVVSYM